MENRRYIAIDLKSFFASVECVERGLDPLGVNLVVADSSRTEKTICLAVSPALKAYGISGRARLFEVVQRVKAVNSERRMNAPGHVLTGKSFCAAELKRNPSLAVDYIIAPPSMSKYMNVSRKVFEIYMKYVSPEDIHVYSVDEVFIDATPYLSVMKVTTREFAMIMIKDVLKSTGITATAGIGTNMYLCKIAMDIVAKHIPADENGVRIAELDEASYRRKLWEHRPLTDFWRVGQGIAKKLEAHGMYTMGDVAKCSAGRPTDFYNEDLLYKLFGINAELLIDHAWGWEPCLISDIKSYRSETNSISSGQVLKMPYTAEKGKLIAREMTDLLVLDLVDKGYVTDKMTLTVCYDIENFANPEAEEKYAGDIETDRYGRRVPKSAHGSVNLPCRTSSTKIIVDKVMELYDRIVNKALLVRRMYVVCENIIPETEAEKYQSRADVQMSMFDAPEEKNRLEESREDEKKLQKAIIGIQKKYGKNSIVKGMNLEDGATTIERNGQIGGHKA